MASLSGSSRARAVFVGATRQHVGKTTTCLALVAGIQRKLGESSRGVGFQKPVGQRHVIVEGGLKVDKDVVLFKEFFGLEKCSYADMSPVVMPSGYTRAFLDGKVTELDQIDAVEKGYRAIQKEHDAVVVEGTGHCAVGSIVQLDNCRVASILGLDMLLVVNGGLGSAFDELALNRLACLHHGVRIRGVICNKVQHDKIEQTTEYLGRALARWNVPLIGVVPDQDYLARPSMLDFEALFKAKVVCNREQWLLRHYQDITLVSMDLRRFAKRLRTEQHTKTLFVTHASRLDIVLGFVAHCSQHEQIWGVPFEAGLVLAGGGDVEASEIEGIVEVLRTQTQCPVMFSSRSTYDTVNAISSHTAKLSASDPKRTQRAVDHYVEYIDLSKVMDF